MFMTLLEPTQVGRQSTALQKRNELKVYVAEVSSLIGTLAFGYRTR